MDNLLLAYILLWLGYLLLLYVCVSQEREIRKLEILLKELLDGDGDV